MIARRRLLLQAVAAGLWPWRGRASLEQRHAALVQTFGDRRWQTGKVTLDVPPLVENGNAVPITVRVDSPMTEAEHVVAIHVFNEKNPQPQVITVRLGPRAGRAEFSTRIKLAASQTILAIAELQDGSLWSADASVVVTVAACIEEAP